MCNRIIGISPKTRNCQRFFDTGSGPLLFNLSFSRQAKRTSSVIYFIFFVPHFPIERSECPDTQDRWTLVPDFIAGLFDLKPSCCRHLCCCIATRLHLTIMPFFLPVGSNLKQGTLESSSFTLPVFKCFRPTHWLVSLFSI